MKRKSSSCKRRDISPLFTCISDQWILVWFRDCPKSRSAHTAQNVVYRPLHTTTSQTGGKIVFWHFAQEATLSTKMVANISRPDITVFNVDLNSCTQIRSNEYDLCRVACQIDILPYKQRAVLSVVKVQGSFRLQPSAMSPSGNVAWGHKIY